ncbi:RusA family crossover junction endodeoxyribonuclease [Citrobacter freundii]|uniref:RusA family crossover junction endodeoxyribonuclease n=1 Tax=Citrobacter freundii TaxID=546 RepID=UPI0015E53B3F|nr:RusA family crossover junction endodeoxyribonuclease [Citrobacter freundii]QLN89177.1 RusA family crossover junction endodeoxyribonuclease [Citrobacter freundii]
MPEYKITPVVKPRMTRADTWKNRPEVLRYRAFCDEVRLKRVELPESGSHVTFILPMPASWSKKKQAEFNGKPHQVKPDFDNMIKALMDAIYENDAHIWDVRASKAWG